MAVDLPNAESREKIIKLLLKGENLNDDISPNKLAAMTELYSGSDLKSLCVSAALAAIREKVGISIEDKENLLDLEQLKNSQPKEKDTISLKLVHFEHAMHEIGPSCSDEMRSLIDLRQWDQQFGEGSKRKSRVKLGFSNIMDKNAF